MTCPQVHCKKSERQNNVNLLQCFPFLQIMKKIFNCFRSSSVNAAVAFAVNTAVSSNPRDLPTPVENHKQRKIFTIFLQKKSSDSFREAAKRKMSITSSSATMRVLSVLRHWVTKHGQDFEGNYHLKNLSIEFLEDIVCTPTLLPAEHKAASQLLRLRNTKFSWHFLV